MTKHKSLEEVIREYYHIRDKEKQEMGREWDMAQCEWLVKDCATAIRQWFLDEVVPMGLKDNSAEYWFKIPSYEGGWNACIEEIKKKL